MRRSALWAKEQAIPRRSIVTGQRVLIVMVLATSLFPLLFVRPDDAPLHVNVFKYLAKTGAFVGSMFLIWQFLLGFRGAVSSVFPDLSWVVDLHKNLGQFGVPIILLHPIFIGLYYGAAKDVNIFALDLGERFSRLVLLGMVTLGVVFFVIVTSTLTRARLAFYRWLQLHLSSYVVPPFLFVHSFLLGPTIRETGLLLYWWIVTAIVATFYLYRIAHKSGVTSHWYRVTAVKRVSDDTTEVAMEPVAGRLRPARGQFIYLRESIRGNSHPYTVSAFNEDNGTLSITAKQEGAQTARLQEAQANDRLLLDGPYGVFTRISMATERPLVMIAGGIGITPFRLLWRTLERDQNREAHLIYANDNYRDISFADELDALEYVNVVHVLNDEPDFDGEKGMVTVEVLERHLPRELSDYQFLICGPPPMVVSLEEGLTEARVPTNQVSHELFNA